MSDLRKIRRRVISPNQENDTIDNLEAQNEYHKICDESGSTDSDYLGVRYSLGCGCFSDSPGGRCAEDGCGKINCPKCFKHCGGSDNPVPEGCGKPLCRMHYIYYTMPGGREVPFCKRCFGKITRRNRWAAVGKFFSKPFVEHEETNE
jgi:hypothetical protein